MKHAIPVYSVLQRIKLCKHIIFKIDEVHLWTNFFLPKLAFLQLLQAVSVTENVSVNIAQWTQSNFADVQWICEFLQTPTNLPQSLS